MRDPHEWHLARAIPVPESGCWLWLGAEKGNGYGNVRRGSENLTASRMSYIKVHGEIPGGMDVCHKCDTRLCINPDHLFLGTRTDNMRDASRKGRTSRGERHGLLLRGDKGPSAKLSWREVRNIRIAVDLGVSHERIATVKKIHVTSVKNIVNHKTWKE